MSGIMEIDFTIFSYLNTNDILKVLNEYFDKNSQSELNGNSLSFYNNFEIKRKIMIKLKFGNKYKINWDYLSYNPNVIYLLEKNLDNINWYYLSKNPNAIHLLEKNLDKINWYSLSENPNAIHLLEKNLDKINWYSLSENPNAI